MKILTKEGGTIEVDDHVLRGVLGIYPEEELINREVFRRAFESGELKFKDLLEESEKILMPWQIFFLTKRNFKATMAHMEKQCIYKVSGKVVAKRQGIGTVTSRRIIDRLIRLQNFTVEINKKLPRNKLSGALKGLSIKEAAEAIFSYLGVTRADLWKQSSKEDALQFLIDACTRVNINISRGTTAHKILPNHAVVPSAVYKNTSGFVLRDEKVPFIFLPGDINPGEVTSRQIYTLVYHLTIIGLEQYGFFLDTDYSASILENKNGDFLIHAVTSEFLLPCEITDTWVGRVIGFTFRDESAKRYKISARAFVTILYKRDLISRDVYQALLPDWQAEASHGRTPRIDKVVLKFCGGVATPSIVKSLKSGSLKSVQAQHLIFGAANKKSMTQYKKSIGL